MLELANSHRSIRSYTNQDIDDALLNNLLVTGLRSSSAGNMQTWSVIVTRDESNKQKLYELHQQVSEMLYETLQAQGLWL